LHQTKKLDFYFKGLNRAMILGQEKLPPVRSNGPLSKETEKIRSPQRIGSSTKKSSVSSQAIGRFAEENGAVSFGRKDPSEHPHRQDDRRLLSSSTWRALTDDALALPPEAAELRR
jgi:hypothetical protein